MAAPRKKFTRQPVSQKKSPNLTVRGFSRKLILQPVFNSFQRFTWVWNLERQERRRQQQHQQLPWQHRRRRHQRRGRLLRQRQLLLAQRQASEQELELELPQRLVQVLVLERVLPSCRKRREQQLRSGRPERENSSFRFSYLDKHHLQKPWRQALRSPATRWRNTLGLHRLAQLWIILSFSQY